MEPEGAAAGSGGDARDSAGGWQRPQRQDHEPIIPCIGLPHGHGWPDGEAMRPTAGLSPCDGTACA